MYIYIYYIIIHIIFPLFLTQPVDAARSTSPRTARAGSRATAAASCGGWSWRRGPTCLWPWTSAGRRGGRGGRGGGWEVGEATSSFHRNLLWNLGSFHFEVRMGTCMDNGTSHLKSQNHRHHFPLVTPCDPRWPPVNPWISGAAADLLGRRGLQDLREGPRGGRTPGERDGPGAQLKLSRRATVGR